jgi:hypothetical protein
MVVFFVYLSFYCIQYLRRFRPVSRELYAIVYDCILFTRLQFLGSKEDAGSPSLRVLAAAQNHSPKPSASPPPRPGVPVGLDA